MNANIVEEKKKNTSFGAFGTFGAFGAAAFAKAKRSKNWFCAAAPPGGIRTGSNSNLAHLAANSDLDYLFSFFTSGGSVFFFFFFGSTLYSIVQQSTVHVHYGGTCVFRCTQ
ncbi:hypothetical protein F5888DRAFT_697796 [Russula emetica]|nr:hypothetical protein F5888DRAFT_697796 [Russula emetica]